MIAAAAGARAAAVDIDPEKLALARELGAEVAIDARDGDPAAAVLEATGGGAHVSLAALGSAATCAASVASLRKRGRHVQVGLLLGGERSVPVPMSRVISLELELAGVHGMAVRHYPALLDAITTGRLDPSPHRLPRASRRGAGRDERLRPPRRDRHHVVLGSVSAGSCDGVAPGARSCAGGRARPA